MKIFLCITLWMILFVFSPLLAIAVLVLLPIVWLISLPIRLVLIVLDAGFQLLKAILLLPARLLGARPVVIQAVNR